MEIVNKAASGPLLCNIMYDGRLDVNVEGNNLGVSSASLVTFADDVAVVATGHNTPILVETMYRVLSAVAKWIADNGQ